MINKVLSIILFYIFFISNISGQFQFVYTGPDSLFVNQNCEVALEWGHPNTPTVTSTIGATIDSFYVYSITDGFQMGDMVNAGLTITVTYRALDDQNNVDYFDFILEIVDTIPPIIPVLPKDESYSCETQENTITTYLHNWYNNHGGMMSGDNCGVVIYIADKTLTETETEFNQSVNDYCGNTRSVTVNFTTRDQYFNYALDTFSATFFTFDNNKPIVTQNPLPLDIICNEDADSLLENWIDNRGGALVEDNCSDSSSIIWKFLWNDNFGSSGYEIVGDKPYDLNASTHCDYSVNINFIAEDECGNKNAAFFTTFKSHDDSAPVFSELPQDTVIDCSNDIPLPDVKAFDDCKGELIVLFSETSTRGDNPDSCNYYSYSIIQKWEADDGCENTIQHFRQVTVIDTTAPSFDVPADIVVGCSQEDDLGVTGMPQNVYDNCYENLNVTFTDEKIGNACKYDILRTWTLKDACGNITEKLQDISVVDTIYPVVEHEPSNITLSCDDNVLFEDAFHTWVNERGNAQISDNCNKVYSAAWVPGSYTPGDRSTYPGDLVVFDMPDTLECANDTVLYYKDVDFVFYDRCFNTLSFTRRFAMVDIVLPQLESCPSDTSYYLPTGYCDKSVQIQMPEVTDNCAGNSIDVNKEIKKRITSDVQGSPTAPVNTLILEIGPMNSGEYNAVELSDLTLYFNKLDADDPTEYFVIYGENGEVLDTTGQTDEQCGDLSIDLSELISIDQFKSWILDGYLTLTLEPNIPSGIGELAINDICNGSNVSVNLLYKRENPNSLRYMMKIDEGAYNFVGQGQSIDTVLGIGNHNIDFKVLDCGNNAALCTQNINVIDDQAPEILCPDDIIIDLPADTCYASIDLPLDIVKADNCESTFKYNKTLPVNPTSALIGFTYNTTIKDYVANSKVFSFENIHNNQLLLNPVLNIKIIGDIDENDEYFEILGEDGTVLGNTSKANINTIAGDCESPGFTTIKIDSSLLNLWAKDGVVSFTARPVVGSNSINPCDASVVNADGDNDGTSKIFITLKYEHIVLAYYIEGETEVDYTKFDDNSIPHIVDFKGGKSKVYYELGDGSENKDTCFFNIEVIDTQAPTAVCDEYYVLFVNPNGVSETKLNPQEVGVNSYDNCGIDSMYVFPNTFDCSDSGTTEDVRLYVWDSEQHVDSCDISIKIELKALEPSFKSGICLHDSLKLFANLPPAPAGTWTIEWTGPLSFTSNLENPIRPNADASYSGTYTLTVTGLNGCQSSGSVEVNIEDLSQPEIQSSKPKICAGEEVLLETNSYSSNVKYFWFEGTYPIGVIIDSTVIPNIVLTPNSGEHYYYVVVKSSNCLSLSSTSILVDVLSQPIAEVESSFISLCEGEILQLETQSTGTTYHWWGPNAFESNNQNPPTIDEVTTLNQGSYYLVVSNDICSDTAKVEVVVLPKPMTPIIEADSVFCEGSDIIFNVKNITNADNYLWYLNDVLFKSETSNSLLIPDANSDYIGEWKVVVKSGNCYSDSSIVKKIRVEEAYSVFASNNGPICEGDSLELEAPDISNANYHWTGPNGYESDEQNPKLVSVMSGEYQLVVTSDLSCTYFASTYVEVKPRPRITALSNDAENCIGDGECVQFFPSVFPNNIKFNYSWTGPNNFVSTDSIAELCNFDVVNNGKYKLIISDGFCSSNTFETEVKVTKKPELPILDVENQSVCEGDSIKLFVKNEGDDIIYHWVTPTNGEFKNKKPFFTIAKVNDDKAGEYYVYLEKDGCVSDESDKINISIIARPNQPYISGPKEVCEGGRIELKLNTQYGPEAKYNWTGPNNYYSSNKNPTVFPATISNSGVYTLSVIVDGCESVKSDGFFVEVIEHPATPIILPIDTAYCINNNNLSVDLCLSSNEANTKYTWYINGATSIYLGESNERCFSVNDFSEFNDGETGIYVVASNGGCLSDDSEVVNINISKAPDRVAQVEDYTFVCDPNEAIIKANSDPNGRWIVYETNAIIEDSTKSITKVFDLDNGENYFIWSLSHGVCIDYSQDTATVYLEYSPEILDDEYTTNYNTEIEFEPIENDINGDNTIIKVEGVGNIYGTLVDNADGTFTYTPDPEFIGTIELKYSLRKESCEENTDEGRIIIHVGDDEDCFGTNIITPNGDGINDNLVFPCLSSGNKTNAELVIFNQWGGQVYQADNYQNDWYGTYKSKDLPVGTYYYILKPYGNDKKVLKGYFVIER